MAAPRIAVLGAGGLIGHAVALDLQRRGFSIRGYARRFTPAQLFALQGMALETQVVEVSDTALGDFLADTDIVINGLGVLQGTESEAVHHAFAERLAGCCASSKLLIHFSVPGDAETDRTAFSRTKREGEAAIIRSGAPYVILRPGFVMAPAAYGGSALIRALAALPFDLPARERGAPFAATAISDICETVAHIVSRWRGGEKHWSKIWEVMEETPGTVGDIVATFRAHTGGPRPWIALPHFIMAPGVVAGDLVSWLGWKPPIRSTAILEMRRGVRGDPRPWMADTGVKPLSAREAVVALPATVQEKWFARLYLLKALAMSILVVFWCVSGLIALTVAFVPARQVLLDHNFSLAAANAATLFSSVLDISVGLLIALRRTARLGLVAGIMVSLGYMIGSALLTPELWIEPLGALVKTGPAIVLMLFCLAMLDDR